jgi:hypothetical protein
VIFSEDKEYLKKQISIIRAFLQDNLRLTLHPNKVSIETIFSGVDFLGWINFPDHRIMRHKTKIRMIKRIEKNNSLKTFSSYIGLLKHSNTQKVKNKVLKLYLENYEK